MNRQGDETSQAGTLILEGDLNIQRAVELKDLLMRSRELNESLLLKTEKVIGADVSCLQVLCSAHRTWMKSGRHLAVEGRLSAALAKAADDAGYRRERGCMHDQQRSCFWVMGDEHE